jgi:hypothetical protein
MHIPSIMLSFCLFIVTASVAAKEIAGVEIPDTVVFADSNNALLLNGAGIREKLFLDIYIGALYLPTRTTDANVILSDIGPASVLMHILYGEISKQKIIAGWKDAVLSRVITFTDHC